MTFNRYFDWYSFRTKIVILDTYLGPQVISYFGSPTVNNTALWATGKFYERQSVWHF